MAKNKNGGSKGYCFIRFQKKKSATEALETGSIMLKGRKLSIRPILTGDALENFKGKIDERRICVTNFPQNLDPKEQKWLKRTFGRFGHIENFYFAKEVQHRENQELTLYITFQNSDSVTKAVNSKLNLREQELVVEKYTRPLKPDEEQDLHRQSGEVQQNLQRQDEGDQQNFISQNQASLRYTEHPEDYGYEKRNKKNYTKKKVDHFNENRKLIKRKNNEKKLIEKWSKLPLKKLIIMTSSNISLDEKNFRFSKDRQLHRGHRGDSQNDDQTNIGFIGNYDVSQNSQFINFNNSSNDSHRFGEFYRDKETTY